MTKDIHVNRKENSGYLAAKKKKEKKNTAALLLSPGRIFQRKQICSDSILENTICTNVTYAILMLFKTNHLSTH